MAAHVKSSVAQQNFGELMDRAIAGEDVVIERYGNPRVVVLSADRYQSLLDAEQELARMRLRSAAREAVIQAPKLTEQSIDALLEAGGQLDPLVVKGVVFGGGVQLSERAVGREGESVLVVFPEAGLYDEEAYQQDWDALERLLDECAVDTGITDLAEEHDHYLHGTPKRSPRDE